MGMVVQHNISAQNANEAMRKNVSGLKKSTEKLSTGYQINRAADNAAGLAISEKMRSQIRGLSQATNNSNDAISLIQTAEGGLQETEDIMQRMRELAVQSANGTYTDEDREQIQFEVDALKAEVDRISQATEFNEMKLLDGSLAGKGTSSGEYGAKYGVITDGAFTADDAKRIASNADFNDMLTAIAADSGAQAELGLATDGSATAEDAAKALGDALSKGTSTSASEAVAAAANLTSTGAAAGTDAVDKMIRNIEKLVGEKGSAGFDGSVLTSNVQGTFIDVTTNATKGGEGASWDKTGKTLTLNLVEGKTYTQEDIDKLIANADTKKADGVVADVSLKLKDGVYTAKAGEYTAKATAGVRAESQTISLLAPDPAGTEAEQALTDAKTARTTAQTDFKTEWETMVGKISDAVSNNAGGTIGTDIADSLKAMGVTGIDATTTKANALTAVDALKDFSASDVSAKLSTLKTQMSNATLWNSDVINATSGWATLEEKIEDLNEAQTNYEKAADAVDSQMNAANVLSAPTTDYGDQIKFTSNSYGLDTREFKIATDAQAGKESVEATRDDSSGYKDGAYTIHLSTGVEYSNSDIEKLMAKAGLDYTVEISDSNKPDGDVKMKLDKAVSEADAKTNRMFNGEGVGKEEVAATGNGLTFQIGANGVEDQRLTVNVEDMSSKALGINNISVAKQDDANDAINKLDDAIKAVSTQRAKLGAVQNRLEHTVNSLNTANENLSAAESQIRDTDMASEMIKYTKSNILQQASQSMLAQANQQPQGVLQLLG